MEGGIMMSSIIIIIIIIIIAPSSSSSSLLLLSSSSSSSSSSSWWWREWGWGLLDHCCPPSMNGAASAGTKGIYLFSHIPSDDGIILMMRLLFLLKQPLVSLCLGTSHR